MWPLFEILSEFLFSVYGLYDLYYTKSNTKWNYNVISCKTKDNVMQAPVFT